LSQQLAIHEEWLVQTAGLLLSRAEILRKLLECVIGAELVANDIARHESQLL
jgi:hypothetical protein